MKFRKVYIAIAATLILTFSVFGILRFGNPQSHKYIYIFQCYYWPKAKTKYPVYDLNLQVVGYDIFRPNKFSGKWRTWYKNGILKEESCFSAGIYDGLSLIWHSNGQMSESINYKKGYYEGSWQSWHENGVKAIAGNYNNGLKEGKWECWHINGKKSKEFMFKRGVHEGYYIIYNHGNKRFLFTFKHGKLKGLVKIYTKKQTNYFENSFGDEKQYIESWKFYRDGVESKMPEGEGFQEFKFYVKSFEASIPLDNNK